MSAPDLSALQALAEARLAQERARLKPVLDEEARLRATLVRLEAQAAAAREGADPALRGIGGDLSWQAWVKGRRAALQVELALVLARKEQALPGLRRAFGKAEAAAALAVAQRAEASRSRATRAAVILADLGTLARGGAGVGPRDQTS